MRTIQKIRNLEYQIQQRKIADDVYGHSYYYFFPEEKEMDNWELGRLYITQAEETIRDHRYGAPVSLL